VRRDAILEAINKHYPELLPFVTSTIGASTDLQFGGFLLKSDEEAQQGDPLDLCASVLSSKNLLTRCSQDSHQRL